MTDWFNGLQLSCYCLIMMLYIHVVSFFEGSDILSIIFILCIYIPSIPKWQWKDVGKGNSYYVLRNTAEV